MSIKNIVTGQVASVTAYNAEGEVSGLSSANLAVDTITAGDIEANNILSVTSLTTNADLSVLGNADVSGNVLAGFFIGDGSQLTGLPEAYGNSDVSEYLSSGTNTAGIETLGSIQAGALGNQTDGEEYASTATEVTISWHTLYSPQPFNIGDTVLISNVEAPDPVGLNGYWAVVGATSGSVTIDCALNPGSGSFTYPYPTIKADDIIRSITATGDITGALFYGNGSQLTGMYGDTNVATYLSSGSQTGNIVVGGIKTDGYFYANGAVFGSSYANSNVAAFLPTYTGNIGNVGNVVSNMFVGNLRKADGNTFITPLRNEWWIDPVNGNDTTGTGTIVSPYKTIAKALVVSAPNGSIYNLAAGAYTEAVTWTKPNINIVGPGTGQLADLQGDQTIAHVAPGSIRFDNVGMQNVVISSSNAATYFYDTHIQGTITKSGNGYVAFDGNDVATGPINITGAGVVQFRNSIVDIITVNNASAAASLLSCTSELANYTVTSGVMGITGSTITGSVGANLVTTAAAGTFVATGTLFSEIDFTPGKLALGGFWSMNAVSFDSANSTITGTNFGAPSYSDAVVTFGSVTALGTIKPRTATVTALGSAATAGVGARATVTNATLATFGSIAVNGGANVVPVYSNGTNWIIG
jgi:hypothetical protein